MDGRSRRAAQTEAAVLDAARELFINRGYVLTTMAAIAETAGVAQRTVYVRFGTKAEILERLVDEVIQDPMGDPALGERLAVQARTAPTLEGRLSAAAEIMAAILCRGGPLMAVVHQAEFSEPSLGRAARAGRQGALTLARAAWRSIAEAGMLHPDSDPEWIAVTTSLLGAMDTWLLFDQTLGWDRATIQDWLYRSWLHVARTPGPPPGPPSVASG